MRSLTLHTSMFALAVEVAPGIVRGRVSLGRFICSRVVDEGRARQRGVQLAPTRYSDDEPVFVLQFVRMHSTDR